MKKLLFVYLLFTGLQAAAQTQLGFSVVGGPAAFLPLAERGLRITPEYASNGGWETGLVCFLEFSRHFEFRSGIRYQESKVMYKGLIEGGRLC